MAGEHVVRVNVIVVRFEAGLARCRLRSYNWEDEPHPGDLATATAGNPGAVMVPLPPRVHGRSLALHWVVIGDANQNDPSSRFDLSPSNPAAPRFFAATREELHPDMAQMVRRALRDVCVLAADDDELASQLIAAGLDDLDTWR